MNEKTAKLARQFATRYRFTNRGYDLLIAAMGKMNGFSLGQFRKKLEAAYHGGPEHKAHTDIAKIISG